MAADLNGWALTGEVLLKQKALFTNTSAIIFYLRTWVAGGDPCVDDWSGVTCSDGSVTKLCGPTCSAGWLRHICAVQTKRAASVHACYITI